MTRNDVRTQDDNPRLEEKYITETYKEVNANEDSKKQKVKALGPHRSPRSGACFLFRRHITSPMEGALNQPVHAVSMVIF